MTGGRGIRARRPLVLTARRAADRLRRRLRKTGGPLGAWLPLALRRRRRPKRSERQTAHRAAAAQWRPQFHLHFAGSLRSRADAASRFLKEVNIREARRFEPALNHTTVRIGALAVDPRRASHLPRRWHVAQTDVSRLDAPRPSSVRLWFREVASIGAQAAAHWRRSRSPRQMPAGASVAVSPDVRVLLGASTRVRQRELPLIHVHSTAIHARIERLFHARFVSAPPAARPPELVWRRGLRAPMDSSDEGLRADSPESPESPGRAAARLIPRPEPAPEPPSRGAQATVLQQAKLDPGLLDRLTDDVIRRVERRNRIERERRGI